MSTDDALVETLIEGYADRQGQPAAVLRPRRGARDLGECRSRMCSLPRRRCAAALAAPTVKKGGTLIEGYDRDFSPRWTPCSPPWDDPDFVAVYEYTMVRDAQGEYKPSLFASWTISSDLLTWTFKLRPEPQVPQRRADARRGGRRELQHLPRPEQGSERDLLAGGQERHRAGPHDRRRDDEHAVHRLPRDAGHRELDDPATSRRRKRLGDKLRRHAAPTAPARSTLRVLPAGHLGRGQPLGQLPGQRHPLRHEQGAGVPRLRHVGADRRGRPARQRDRDRQRQWSSRTRRRRTSAG